MPLTAVTLRNFHRDFSGLIGTECAGSVCTVTLADIAGSADTLLCEIKAAGIDVATRRALEHDLDVVYMDNTPVGVEGEDPAETYRWAAALAAERFGG